MEAKAGECEGTECTPASRVSDYYMNALGSIRNQLYQLFKTHNSAPIKDLLQQTKKQSTGTTETEHRGCHQSYTVYKLFMSMRDT